MTVEKITPLLVFMAQGNNQPVVTLIPPVLHPPSCTFFAAGRSEAASRFCPSYSHTFSQQVLRACHRGSGLMFKIVFPSDDGPGRSLAGSSLSGRLTRTRAGVPSSSS